MDLVIKLYNTKCDAILTELVGSASKEASGYALRVEVGGANLQRSFLKNNRTHGQNKYAKGDHSATAALSNHPQFKDHPLMDLGRGEKGSRFWAVRVRVRVKDREGLGGVGDRLWVRYLHLTSSYPTLFHTMTLQFMRVAFALFNDLEAYLDILKHTIDSREGSQGLRNSLYIRGVSQHLD